MRPIALVAAAVLALAAGCISDRPSGDGQEALAPAPTVIRGDGAVMASGPALAYGSETNVSVAANVTLLLAEIAWDDPVQDLDLALASPSARSAGGVQSYDHQAAGGAPGAPDSPHSLAVEVPETGDWRVTAFGNGGAAVVEYRVAVTLFHGETVVPDGYTAFR